MVKANELRYGNKIIASGLWEGRVLTFKSLDDSANVAFFQEHTGAGEYLNDCDGIPLTAEILEVYGFKMSLTRTCYGMVTPEGKSRFSIFEDGRFMVETSVLPNEIKHLHQLQNLYFSLTGEELAINLPQPA